MNMNCMTNVLKKLAFPLVAGGMLMAVSTATAQDYGDIERIFKFPEGAAKYLAPITTPGETVAFRIRLFNAAGNFSKVYVGAGSAALDDLINPFMMQIETGQGLTYAKLTGMTAVSDDQTDLEFTYTVRVGDMALPMTLYGNAGSTAVGTPYQFLNDNIWKIRNLGNSSNTVWRFLNGALNADPTFAKANVRLQTVDFESEEWSVQKTTTLLNCLVQTTTGQAVSNNVPLYVWSGDTNIAQIVEQQAGQNSAAVTLLPGESQRAFRIYGKNEGQTLIYLSPSPSMTAGVTNYITKTVTVTAPPPPTVGIALDNSLTPDALGYVTLTESDEPVNPLRVTLSESYPQDITVRLDVAPAAGNIVFDAAPKTVVIPANATESPVIAFAAADGTASSRVVPGVIITPVILNAAASNHFNNTPNAAKIKILNVAPSFVMPIHGSVKNANTLQDIPFEWLIEDVAADMAAGMTNIWNFGDTPTEFTQVGASGTINHMYQDPGDYTVSVYAKDKDGSISSVVTFTVRVTTASTPPFIEPVLSLPGYDETNGIGSVSFRLSRDYSSSDVYVRLEIEPADQSNVVFDTLGPIPIYRGETNSAALEFRILDGTDFSRLTGLTFTPVITNAPANTFFSPRPRRGVKIVNTPPVITRILDQRVGLITNFVSVPASVPKVFTIEVADVNADNNPVTTYWNFGDGTGDHMAPATSNRNGFATGSITHTFSASGTYTVIVRAEDKDNGTSQEVEFNVYVAGAPTVRILPPSGPIFEMPNTGEKDFIVVQLSSEYTNAVTVDLAVTPANSPTAGTLILNQYQVVFPAGVIGRLREQKVYIADIKDGTDASAGYGFTITPSVTATPGAQAFYTINSDSLGTVRILNEAPIIVTPVASEITGTTVAFTIAQDTDHTFNWNITDAMKDWTGSYMRVTWYWGDNSSSVVYGKTGSIVHNYTGVGDKIIHVIAEDKDGGYDDVYFKIRVAPSKQVNVSPVGPIRGGEYASAPGLGYGLIFSPDAASRYIENNVYHYRYDPDAVSAELVAVPYKTSFDINGDLVPYRVTNYTARVVGLPGTTALGAPTGPLMQYDSFVYVWRGSTEALEAKDLISVASPSVLVSLPQGDGGGGDGAAPAVKALGVDAIFSREWRPADNCGDISNDGIPDLIANLYGLPALAGGDMMSAADYNGDLDFLPGAASDGGGIIGGSGNTWAAVGRPFTAFLETRGYHEGLNRIDYGSDDDMTPQEEAAGALIGPQTQPATKGAERPTDPTKLDSDGDGYPDGWEYFFWYDSLVNRVNGVRYNPLDIATGAVIPWEEIYLKFDPLVPATDLVGERDLDGDGLTDYEELVGGTNPIHWDTDGDGMCDGWEVMRGLNPTDARDALDTARNNPDGDYMAISVVSRDLVTALDGQTYLQDLDGNLTTWYRYGSTNETTPMAVGRPVEGVNLDGAIDPLPVKVLILHFQVYHEFGFDPRTAWAGAVPRMQDHAQNFPVPEGWAEISSAPGFSRFGNWVESDAANTRPFTTLDEYLLMKFMSETRLAGAGASIGGALRMADKENEWARWSTHPLTPDTDASAALADGVPDGWELYVACRPGTHAMGITPWSAEDGDDDVDDPASPNLGEGLSVRSEFAGTDSVTGYANAALYGAGLPAVTITRPIDDQNWINKFWPTDPWVKDTDGDRLNDNAERAFQYGSPSDNGSTCIAGGGLNPCSMDTDLDGLPDAFENEFAPNAEYPLGMNGTVSDADQDWDKDGLLNYQEYYVQAVRHFRYDIPTNNLAAADSMTGMDLIGQQINALFHPSSLFTMVDKTWDVARYPWGDTRPQLWVLLPVGHANLYVCTDPRDHDTDQDNMDDYYEMYHGLNPILGVGILASGLDDRVGRAYIESGAWHIDYGSSLIGNDWGAGLPMDFVAYPWLAGMPYADPDADGLNNFEEMILANTAAPAHANTDPTPLWMTDLGFFPAMGTFSLDSLTVRFYGPRGASLDAPRMFFWPGTRALPDSYHMFDFEMTEGFDTDNDGVSDKSELLQGPNGNSDPQDQDDPYRRQALWLSGNQSAAQTLAGFSYDPWSLLSFTVELWAKPEAITSQAQVLVERPVLYTQTDLSTPTEFVRRNFQLGIEANTGRVFARFENAGTHDDETGVAYAEGRPLATNEWVHIAARMDGNSGLFTLLVNGEVEKTVQTALMPANGVQSLTIDPGVTQTVNWVVSPGVIVVGAANDDPGGPPAWGAYSGFYQGYVDEIRIWDGARATADIQADYRKRYHKVDLLSNRQAVAQQRGSGYTRVIGEPNQLMPELLYHYTFDNLFSASDAAVVATAPRGFTADAVTTNKPNGGVAVPWWDFFYGALKSQVYTEYSYVPWIENGVEHLASPAGIAPNSVYWALGSYGGVSETNLFPLSNDPYTMAYDSRPGSSGVTLKSDLLPLGMAWAKQTEEMWDVQGASGNWADSVLDSDSDGLADWWEVLYGLDTASGGIGPDGWYGDPDGDGMTNGERYLRDLAAGYRFGDALGAPTGPRQVADADHDGMPDWWEQMFGLNPGDATGGNGPQDDPDEDGLTNLYEYLAGTDPFAADTDNNGTWDAHEDSDGDGLANDEEFQAGTDPWLKDTDDDGFTDDVEIMNNWDPVASGSPGRKRVLALDGAPGSFVESPHMADGTLATRLALERFSLGVRVYPTAAPGAGNESELINREIGTGVYNYRLVIDENMQANLTYQPKTGAAVSLTVPQAFALPLERWSMVTAQVAFDVETNAYAKIFINGVEAAQQQISAGALTAGAYGLKAVTRVGRGFAGYLDDVSVSTDEESRLVYRFDDATSYDAAVPAPAFGSLLAVYADNGQVEDSADAVHAAAPDWGYENWRIRHSAAGTLRGNAVITYFSDVQLGEDELDSDGDGLPDQWELDNGFSPTNPDSDGDTISDALEDTDGDGLSNYYEYLAGLDPRNPSTDGATFDGEGDADGDGLLNKLEQTYGTMPGDPDTDDDGISDYEEIFGTTVAGQTIGASDPLVSLSPYIPRGLQVGGAGAVLATNQVRHALKEWTAAAWIQPAALQDGVVLARSYRDGNRVNYELGVEVNGGMLSPYARYTAQGTGNTTLDIKVGHTATAPGSIPVYGQALERVAVDVGRWTHLAAAYSPDAHTLYLFVDGDCVAYRTDAVPLPVVNDIRWTLDPQFVIGARRLDAGAAVGGFSGQIDDVRVAAYAVDERGARQMMGKQMVEDTTPVIPTNGTTVAKADGVVTPMPAPAVSVPGEFLVGLRQGVDAAAVAAKFKNDFRVDTVRRLALANALYVRVEAGQDAALARSKMKADAAVRYVEPNYIVNSSQTLPTDPRFAEQWGLHNTGQNGGVEDADVDMPEAWAASSGNDSVIVAVIDTGVDYEHEDLAANMWTNPGEVAGNGIDDDGNGIVDDVHGMRAVFGEVTGDPMDDHSHGTHCAGVIGASGNGATGIAGMNWSIKIMALKFLGASGGGTTADAITCIDYAVQMGALLSNNSWGGGGYSQALYDTIARARDSGHLFVAAAGNDGMDNDLMPHYPSSYDLDNIISVAATDNRDELARFSNYGAISVDLAAPGVDILSTVLNNGYGLMSGTSMATPHVTGAAALILAVDGSLSYAAVASALMNNGDPCAAVAGKSVSGMRLNIGNILPSMVGEDERIRVRALAAWFRFDDGGRTVQDFTLNTDWRTGWMHAGTLVGDATNAHGYAHLNFGDTDQDSLPDWWEEAVGLDPYSALEDDGAAADIDGDGLSNFTEYRASLARMARGRRGLDPFMDDTDHDGVSDANDDSDLDGLSNILEQNQYLTDAGSPDTDDDGKMDSAEVNGRSDPADAMTPRQDLALTFTGGANNTVVMADKVNTEYTARYSASEWTIETWVCPGAALGAGYYPLISRRVIETGLRNYELGLLNGQPYVLFDAPDGTQVRALAGSQVPMGGWIHLAGRFDLGDDGNENALAILINGVSVAATMTGAVAPVGAGDLILGSSGFVGQMLNTRIWRMPQSDEEIVGMMGSELQGGNMGPMYGYLDLNGFGHVKESAVTVKSNGETIDMLHENWTLECWVKVPPFGGGGRLIARRNQAEMTETDFNYCLEVTAGGTLRGRFNVEYGAWTDTGQPYWVWVSGEDSAVNDIEGEIPVNDGEWHHVAYVRDANFCYLYVDGLLDAKQNRLLRPVIENIYPSPDNYVRVKVTGGPVVLGEYVMGALDETRIWNRELSTAELQQVSKGNLSGKETGLISYFNFDFQLGELADERAAVRDPDSEYGIYIPEAMRLAGTDDGPPIHYDPLYSIQGVSLIGLFLGIDGGTTLEDRVYRMGVTPFAQDVYAGRMGAAVSMALRQPGYWPAECLDSDGDGLPDDWEWNNGFDPFYVDSDGDGTNDYDDDHDGDGFANGAEWMAGTDPGNADSDSDGIMDGEEDSDGDGLVNKEEMRLGSDPGTRDTDDDGMEDGPEVQAGTHPVFSESPKQSMSLALTAGQIITIPQPLNDRTRFNNKAWTLEMWVNPSTPGQTASLVGYQASAGAGAAPVMCYQLGLAAGVPYVQMATDIGTVVEVQGGTLPVNEWTHVCGVFDPEQDALTLYLNGYALASQYVMAEGLVGSPSFSIYQGTAMIGGGFDGHLDDVRVWKQALGQDQVVDGIEHLVPAGDTRLVCSFRFDDGGLTAEDSAHPIRPAATISSRKVQWPASFTDAREYCLAGVTFDAAIAYDGLRMAFDDYDGDGLPDWWESFSGYIETTYPVVKVVTVTEGTGSSIVWVDKYLALDYEVTEDISPAMERSSSVLDLGWGVQYGPVTSVPRYSRPDGTRGGYLDTIKDAAWLLKDVYISAEELETVAVRFTSHSIAAEDILCINGRMIPLNTLQYSSVNADANQNTENYRRELWENRYNFQLEPEYLRENGYFKIGWNRIAVKLLNQDSEVGSRRYEYFDLTMTARGDQTLIDYGERWYLYGFTGSLAEPPKDAQGRDWTDPSYGLDTGADLDADGLPNNFEMQVGSNPNSLDSDGDGVPDTHEDPDGDGLQNLLEYRKGTDPRLPDTDDDGRLDSADGYIGANQPWSTNSLQPYIERHLHVSGDGFVQAPLVSRWSSDEGSFTLRLSVRPASLPAGTPAVLAAREVSSGVFNYAILLRTDGRVQVSVTTDTGGAAPQQLDVVSAAAIPVGQWSTVDMVADLDMQRLLLLVNGQNSGSAFGNMSRLPAASGKGLARAYFGAGLNGDLDNIAFYRAALSEYQLKRIREEGALKVATPSLYGCYLFDDGTSAAGVSGMGSWRTGQVQDFACIFWSADDQEVAGFTLRDWERGWFNAGTLYGAQTAIIDTYPMTPTTDWDEDGLPDTWEMTYGFDPYDSTGENGALADPDGDGLSNYAEYLAANVYSFHAVNPRLFSTKQSVSDYFLRTGSLYLGEMFTDHDFMEDAWEDGFAPDKVSAAIYDAHLDNDEDGWSNWAEARFSAAKNDVRPDQVTGVTQAGQSRHEFPTPVVETLVRYNGILREAAIVVEAYKDAAMDGQPDATFRMATGTGAAGSMTLGDWRPRTVSGTLTPGNVQRGSVSLVFTDGWTGGSMATGFDQEGLLYRGDPLGEYEVIGTIDYASGAYTLDLAAFAGQTLDLAVAGVGQTLARDQYIDCEQSSVVMNYSYRLVENWPKRLFLGRATTGYLREGLNTFFAFMDSNNNGTWDAGEPCGLPQPAATAIGWDRNEIVIELTDYMQGYLRMAMPSGVRSEDVFNGVADDAGGGDQAALEQRVRIVRTGVDGQKRHTRVVFDKVLRAPRAWLHEGDLWAQGDLALDWGLMYVDTALDRTRLSYEVFLGETTTFTNGAVAFFTNVFDVVRAKAVNVAPINGAYVYSARPTFKWRLPAGSETKYPAFAFEMRLGSTTGTLMYESGAMPVPARNANGEFVWEAPIYANTRLPNGQVFQSNKVYAWRVIAMNAKFSDTASNWSDWKYFRLDVNAPMQSSGYGSAEARVKYYGPAAAMLTGRVKVQAYRTASFTGMPEAEYTLAGTDLAALTSLAAPVVNARLYGLQDSGVAGSYYLCAYIDHNGNDVRDPWESWGYANHYGVDAEMPYMARAVDVVYSAEAPRLDIVIEDADTDQDWVPDAWEYEQNPAGDFLGLVGPSTGAAGDTEINPYLGSLLSQTQASAFFTALALGTTDLDGDGLGDLNELVLGSDARSASTAGDGYNDGDKTALGLNPVDALRLDVTGITLANGLPEVDWSVAVERSGVSTLSLAPEVTYELLYTPSLSNPQWQVVRSGKVALDGVQTLTSQIESAVSVDPAQGFFRVRLQK